MTNEQSQNNKMGMRDGCIKLLKFTYAKGWGYPKSISVPNKWENF